MWVGRCNLRNFSPVVFPSAPSFPAYLRRALADWFKCFQVFPLKRPSRAELREVCFSRLPLPSVLQLTSESIAKENTSLVWFFFFFFSFDWVY